MIKVIKTGRLSDSKQRQSSFTASLLGLELKAAIDHQEQVQFSGNSRMPKQYTGTTDKSRRNVDCLPNKQCSSLKYCIKSDTCHSDETS